MSISTEEPVPDTGISCRNGGFPMSDGVSITDCNCPRYWGSDPEQANATMCDVRICVNGGYNDPVKDVCVCPQGYLGVHCEASKRKLKVKGNG